MLVDGSARDLSHTPKGTLHAFSFMSVLSGSHDLFTIQLSLQEGSEEHFTFCRQSKDNRAFPFLLNGRYRIVRGISRMGSPGYVLNQFTNGWGVFFTRQMQLRRLEPSTFSRFILSSQSSQTIFRQRFLCRPLFLFPTFNEVRSSRPP